jgi:PAS domain S-box-containing protein
VNELPPIPGLAPDLLGPSDFGLARDPTFIDLVTNAYRRRLGTSLLPPTVHPGDAAGWLYHEAPFCLLAHNTAADPRFVYANRTAQTCFGYDWDEITSLPSRLSAETPNQVERQELIDAVRRAGFVTGYRGLRIAKSGRRFWIENVTMWQLTDATGAVRGQAAIYGDWRDA